MKFFLNLTEAQNVLSRKCDRYLSGVSLSEFLILFHLSQTEDTKLRRVDLADKVGLTSSGVTRILLPMEKIGLLKKEVNAHDARSSLVSLTESGRRVFQESVERIELFCQDVMGDIRDEKLDKFSDLLHKFGAMIR